MLKGRAAEGAHELCYNDRTVEEDRRLQPRRLEGRVRVAILHMSDHERVLKRQLLLQTGRYS
jgi:hypothetical protein